MFDVGAMTGNVPPYKGSVSVKLASYSVNEPNWASSQRTSTVMVIEWRQNRLSGCFLIKSEDPDPANLTKNRHKETP